MMINNSHTPYQLALNPIEASSLLKSSYHLLTGLDETYPNFSRWLYSKIYPGFSNGSRKIITIQHRSNTIGLALVKKSYAENKICTLIVSKNHRGAGIGARLLDLSIQILNDPTPLITVPECQLQTLGPLLDSRKFILKDVVFDYYRKHSCEYIFNGYLTPPIIH